MSLPHPPCGGTGEPPCPPQPAIETMPNALNVVRWLQGLTAEHRATVVKAAIERGDNAPTAADL